MKLFSVLNGLGWLGAVCAILLIQVIGQLAVDHDWWSPLYPTLLWVGMAMGMLCRGCAMTSLGREVQRLRDELDSLTKEPVDG